MELLHRVTVQFVELTKIIMSSSTAFVLQSDKVRDDLVSGDDAPRTWSEWFRDNFETLIDNACNGIPSDDVQALPKIYRYSIGIFFYATLITIFSVLFTRAFYKSIHTQYLSPYYDSAASNDHCDSISATNTGSFLATQSGVWEGSATFEYSNAAYQLQVSYYEVEEEGYKKGMEFIYSTIYNLTGPMEASDLATNLLVWMSFNIKFYGVTNFFAFTGDPTYIFDRQHSVGSFSSIHGVCRNATSASGYDFATSSFYSTFGYESFIGNQVCNQAAIPDYLGYVEGKSSNTFEIIIDVRSLITALSINIGLTQIDQMNQISSTLNTFIYEGQLYTAAQYYNAKYPGMDPIYCINSTQLLHSNEQCVLLVAGSTFAIPFFNHIGENQNIPTPCNCTKLTTEDLSDPANPCNVFNFVGGIFFWNTTSYESVMEQFAKVNRDMVLLNQQTFNASFISSYFGQTSKNKTMLNSAESLLNAFEFCNIPHYGYCSMLTFTAFDVSAYTYGITEYFFQLTNGACTNSLLTSQQNW